MVEKMLGSIVNKFFVIATGMLLFILLPTSNVLAQAAPRRAVISALEGPVLIQAAGQSVAVPAKKNMDIKSGDRIITGRDGTAEIRFDDGSISRIGPQSRVDINEISSQLEGPKTAILDLQRGSVWNNTKEIIQRGSRFEINTPAAVAAVRGTKFSVSVEGTTDTFVRVYEGVVGFGPVAPPTGPSDDNLPLPARQEISVKPFQQAVIVPSRLPPSAPDPLDVLAVNDFEKDNLVDFFPVAYVEIEVEAKTIQLQKAEEMIQKELEGLALAAGELDIVEQKLFAETDPVNAAKLEVMQKNLQEEINVRYEIIHNLEAEQHHLFTTQQKLIVLKERIEIITPEELQAAARTLRKAEKDRSQEQWQRRQRIIRLENSANTIRQKVFSVAQELGLTEMLQLLPDFLPAADGQTIVEKKTEEQTIGDLQQEEQNTETEEENEVTEQTGQSDEQQEGNEQGQPGDQEESGQGTETGQEGNEATEENGQSDGQQEGNEQGQPGDQEESGQGTETGQEESEGKGKSGPLPPGLGGNLPPGFGGPIPGHNK